MKNISHMRQRELTCTRPKLLFQVDDLLSQNYACAKRLFLLTCETKVERENQRACGRVVVCRPAACRSIDREASLAPKIAIWLRSREAAKQQIQRYARKRFRIAFRPLNDFIARADNYNVRLVRFFHGSCL